MHKPTKPRQAKPGSTLATPAAAPSAPAQQVSSPSAAKPAAKAPPSAAPALVQSAAPQRPSAPPVSASPRPVAVAALPPRSPPSYRDWAALSRDNFGAVLKANGAVTEGLEAIGKEMIGYAQKSIEQATRTATALIHAKNLDEIIHLNSAYTTSSIESLLARSASMSDLGFKLASEALAPLSRRVEANLATLTKPLAP